MRSRAVSEGASAEVRSSSEREESIVSPSCDHISLSLLLLLIFFIQSLAWWWYVAENVLWFLLGGRNERAWGEKLPVSV